MASCFQTKSKKTSRRPSAYKAAKSRDLLACVNGGEHLVRFLKGPSSGYFSCLKKGRKAAYNNLDDLILHIFFISPPKIHDPLGLMSSEFCVCPSQKASFCFFLVGRLKASWLNDNASIEHRGVFFFACCTSCRHRRTHRNWLGHQRKATHGEWKFVSWLDFTEIWGLDGVPSLKFNSEFTLEKWMIRSHFQVLCKLIPFLAVDVTWGDRKSWSKQTMLLLGGTYWCHNVK